MTAAAAAARARTSPQTKTLMTRLTAMTAQPSARRGAEAARGVEHLAGWVLGDQRVQVMDLLGDQGVQTVSSHQSIYWHIPGASKTKGGVPDVAGGQAWGLHLPAQVWLHAQILTPKACCGASQGLPC